MERPNRRYEVYRCLRKKRSLACGIRSGATPRTPNSMLLVSSEAECGVRKKKTFLSGEAENNSNPTLNLGGAGGANWKTPESKRNVFFFNTGAKKCNTRPNSTTRLLQKRMNKNHTSLAESLGGRGERATQKQTMQQILCKSRCLKSMQYLFRPPSGMIKIRIKSGTKMRLLLYQRAPRYQFVSERF